jgi:hypothetical protein
VKYYYLTRSISMWIHVKATWSDAQTFGSHIPTCLIRNALSFNYFHQDGIDIYTYLPKAPTSQAIQIRAMMNSVLFYHRLINFPIDFTSPSQSSPCKCKNPTAACIATAPHQASIYTPPELSPYPHISPATS